MISADNVFRNEVVETLDGGALQIEFVDGTIFQLGENARMILNELVFDPVTGEGGLLVNLVEGVFRIISGAIPSENFTVVTPAATIGIRGTDFEVAVDEFGVTAVSVFEGEVEVEPNDDQPGVGPGQHPVFGGRLPLPGLGSAWLCTVAVATWYGAKRNAAKTGACGSLMKSSVNASRPTNPTAHRPDEHPPIGRTQSAEI